MRQIRVHKAGGHTHLRTVHFNKWLREAYPANGIITPPPIPPMSYWWQKLVDITQFMWKHGGVPRELGWAILVLISKGNTDTRGIGLLE